MKRRKLVEYKIFSWLEIIIGFLFFASIILTIYNGLNFGTGTLLIFSFSLIVLLCLKRFKEKHRYLRKLYFTMCVGFTVWVSSFIVFQLLVFSQMTYELKSDEYEYIMVLGAGLRGDKLSLILQQRLDKAIEVSNEILNAKIIVSGGQGPDEYISEAEAMKRYLVKNGIEESRIILEDKSTSTAENFKFSKKIYDDISEENGRVLFITNEYHIYRAKKLADKLSFKVDGIACRTPLMIRLNQLAREYIAMIKSAIFD